MEIYIGIGCIVVALIMAIIPDGQKSVKSFKLSLEAQHRLMGLAGLVIVLKVLSWIF